MQDDYLENIDILPDYMHEAMIAWIETGRMPGNFLSSLLSNNLFLTFHHADQTNLAMIGDYINYLYNYTPGECWGSPDKVRAWKERGGLA